MRLKDFEAAIFDLDGTVFDSMNVWKNVDLRFFNRHSLFLTDDYFDNIMHKTLTDSAKYTIERYALNMTTEEVVNLSLIHISSPRDRTRSRMPSSA